MATKEKGSVFEVGDDAVSRKATQRGAGAAGFTRVLGTAMLLMTLTVVYLVYLHVRLNKLEQCQCIVDTARNWAVNDDVVDDERGELIDKVRISFADCSAENLCQRQYMFCSYSRDQLSDCGVRCKPNCDTCRGHKSDTNPGQLRGFASLIPFSYAIIRRQLFVVGS